MKEKRNCYLVAGNMILDMLDNQNIVLVHGIVTGQGKLKGRKFGHAWIEIGDVVLDYSAGKQIIMRKEKYYKIGKIKKVKRYTIQEAAKLMLEKKNYGPWE